MLADKSEKRRSTASESINHIFNANEDPQSLLETLFDSTTKSFVSPSQIEAEPLDRKNSERAIGILEKWTKTVKVMLDSAPLLMKFWSDSTNDLMVSFITKASSLFDKTQLLSLILQKLDDPINSEFDTLAPILILKSQPSDFFSSREVMASNLFLKLFVFDDKIKSIQRLRGEILARYFPDFLIPILIEHGLNQKFILFIICMCGNYHNDHFPLVANEIEKMILDSSDDLFEPLCDSFYFPDKERFVRFSLFQDGSEQAFLLL